MFGLREGHENVFILFAFLGQIQESNKKINNQKVCIHSVLVDGVRPFPHPIITIQIPTQT